MLTNTIVNKYTTTESPKSNSIGDEIKINPSKYATIYKSGLRFKDMKDNEDNSFVITMKEIREAV